jgi:hypothetical protein
MIDRTLLCAIIGIAAVYAVVDAGAADRSERTASLKTTAPQSLRIPGTEQVVTLGVPKAKGQPPSEALVAALSTWLANNFDLPRTRNQPVVQLHSSTRIATFHHTGLLSDRPQDVAMMPPGQREVVAAYDPLANAIYLPADWTGSSAAELSVLVHELVHHLQHVGHRRHACPQESEELAYAAQEKWLGLFGRSLAADFDIDPFTLLVSVRCSY